MEMFKFKGYFVCLLFMDHLEAGNTVNETFRNQQYEIDEKTGQGKSTGWTDQMILLGILLLSEKQTTLF